jgi:hypothetical protein
MGDNPFGAAETDEDWQDPEGDPAGALLGAQLRPIPMSDELEVRATLLFYIPSQTRPSGWLACSLSGVVVCLLR